MQQLEYGDPDTYDATVMPSAVCTCKNYECQARPNLFGHEAFRHTFGNSHDSQLFHEMKLFFDRSTIEPASLVEVASVVTLREEGGFLTPERKVYRIPHYEGDVPLQPKEFVPGTATLIGELIKRSNVLAADRRQVAIGVPASFGDVGKRHLREAVRLGAFGKLADCSGILLYPEPLAAARSYMELQIGNLLVLDYGGGTLDITVMTVERLGQLPRKLTSSGFPEGGSRMDEAILTYCLSKGGAELQKWYEAARPRQRLQVKRNVELGKIALSVANEATIELPGSPIEPVRLSLPELHYALQPIITRMVAKVTETIIGAVEKMENIHFVVLSGGTSLNKVVQNNVLSMFKHIPPDRFVLPDPTKPESVETCLCAVARGLAWLSHEAHPAIVLAA